MELDLTDEQRLLADTVNGLLDKRYDANTRLGLIKTELGWSREMWAQYAEVGLLGLTFDEKYGGAGMGAGELAIVMESFGRSLVLEPFLSTVVLGGSLVAAAGTDEQKAEILPKVAAGELLLAFAHTEPTSRWSLTDLATTASQDGTSGRSPARRSRCSAPTAPTSSSSRHAPATAIGLFLVAGSDVTRSPYRMQDDTRGADVLLSAAPAVLLGLATDAVDVIAGVIDVATAALCAEAVGAMNRMLWMTVDYLKTREQFGAPIAVFQALQFRAADMYVSLEQARSMALLARFVAGRRRPCRAAPLGARGEDPDRRVRAGTSRRRRSSCTAGSG